MTILPDMVRVWHAPGTPPPATREADVSQVT
jgi:hypothetical protein